MGLSRERATRLALIVRTLADLKIEWPSNIKIGWMTAELFVKLSAKLHAERKHIGDVSDDDSESASVVDDGGYSGDDDETGGALLSHSFNGLAHLSIKDNVLPEWHARQLNPYSVLNDLGENLPNAGRESHPRQLLPSFASSFWDVYVNKLRVNAVEGGICILDKGRGDLIEGDW
jgi:poly(A)-specific ribonuclease